MNFRRTTANYETWLARHLTLLPAELKQKHELMRSAPFPFFRATYYRWAQLWPEITPRLDEPDGFGRRMTDREKAGHSNRLAGSKGGLGLF